jgi:DNA-binding NarL/FixJ family response regulator
MRTTNNELIENTSIITIDGTAYEVPSSSVTYILNLVKDKTRSLGRAQSVVERNAEIVRLRASGVSVAKIAEKMGMTQANVYGILRRNEAS